MADFLKLLLMATVKHGKEANYVFFFFALNHSYTVGESMPSVIGEYVPSV